MEKNYRMTSIGTFKSDLANKGRVMVGKDLELTGSEISFNYLPANQHVPFVHTHKLNEEVYIIISGKGTFMLDNEEIDIEEGNVIRVAPACERAIKASSEALVFVCIQAKDGSLTQATHDDGIITETKASWMK